MNFTHKSLYHILGKSLLLFTVFFFFFFHNCFSLFHEKEKEMCFSRRSAVKWFCLCWLQILCDVVFFFIKKVSKSYQQNHVLYTSSIYKIIYQKKKNMTKKRNQFSSSFFYTSLHSFSCRLFKTYVNILSRAFYYCLRSLSRSRNLTLKACSTAAAKKKRMF